MTKEKQAKEEPTTMKIRVFSQYMLQAVQRCARMSYDDDKDPFPLGSFIRLIPDKDQLQLTVVNPICCVDTVINCDVQVPGPGVLFNCSELGSILHTLHEGSITIETTEKRATVRDERNRSYNLQIQGADQYVMLPAVSGKSTAEIPGATLRSLLESVRFATPADIGRPQLCFVLLRCVENDKIRAYASDGHVLARRELDCPGIKQGTTFGVPSSDANKRDSFFRSLLDTTTTDPLKLTASESKLFVESPDTLYCTSLTAYAEDFVTARESLGTPPEICIVNTTELKRTLAAVCVLARREREVQDQLRCVRLKYEQGQLKLLAKTPRFTAEDKIDAAPAGGVGGSFDILIAPELLKDALNSVHTPTVIFANDSGNIAMIFSEDHTFDCMIMKMEDR